jgi:hypothetical protein
MHGCRLLMVLQLWCNEYCLIEKTAGLESLLNAMRRRHALPDWLRGEESHAAMQLHLQRVSLGEAHSQNNYACIHELENNAAQARFPV